MRSERKRLATKRRNGRATKGKPTVSIIGAGRLGTALARALAAQGYSIEAVVARSTAHARRAADLVGAQQRPRALSGAQLNQLPSSDILFITTPDDRIARVAAKIAATFTKGVHTHTALHASGALTSDALISLRGARFHLGSMHPLISVSDPVHGAESLREAFFCVEGDGAAVRVARGLVRDLGAQSFSIGTRDKALYHAAAVMASGHAVALFDLATEMLVRCGLKESRARRVLIPLLQSTINNLSTQGPARALTGTFARADLATVRKHLDALRSQNLSSTLAAYTLLGQRSLQLAKQNGTDSEALKEITLALEKAENSKRQAAVKRGRV